MKTVKIYFVDFWDGFDPNNNFFTRLLSVKYDLVIDPVSPDYVFHSCFSFNIYKYPNAVKIYFTGENDVPDFNLADYALGFHYIDFGDRYLRFPLYLLDHYSWNDLDTLSSTSVSAELVNSKFSNLVYSNKKNDDPIRDKFFFELSKYKKVDSGGRLYNNIGGPVKDKCAFLRDYKFTIAFENSSVNGYTTEKVVEPMLVNSIPIYWGNKLIGRDFNKSSILVVKDENDFDRVIDEIKFLDQNDDAYLSKLKQNWFVRENEKEYWTDLLMSFLDNIFEQSLLEAKRCPKFGFVKNYIREEERVSHLKKNYLWNKMCGLVEKISNKN